MKATSTKSSRVRYDSISLPRALANASNVYIGQSVAFGSFTVAPDGVSETIAHRFSRLVDQWIADTRFENSMTRILRSEPLQEIISLGEVAVPLILKD